MKKVSIMLFMLVASTACFAKDVQWQGGTVSFWNTTGTNWADHTSSDLLWDSDNGVTNNAMFSTKASVTLQEAVTAKKIDATNGLDILGSKRLTVSEISAGNRSAVMLNTPMANSATIDKSGNGSLTLISSPTVTFTNTNPVVVRAGTLQLRTMQPLPTSGLVCRLDASNLSTIFTNASNLVTNWVSAVGGHCFTQRLSGLCPSYNPNGMGGRGAVKFADDCLAINNQIKVYTLFFVLTRENVPAYKRLCGKMGPGAIVAGDGINTMNNATNWRWNLGAGWMYTGFSGKFFLYGISGDRAVQPGTPQLLMLEREAAAVETSGIVLGLGSFAYQGIKEGISADINEMLIYDRALTASERREVERYLADKWWGIEEVIPLSINPTVGSSTNILSKNDLTLAALSQLDLYGNSQSFTSLQGDGTIVNSATARVSTITLQSSTNMTLSTHLSLNTKLVKDDTTTWRIAESGSYAQTEVRTGEIILEKAVIPKSGLLFHLDANKTNSIILGAGVDVVEWRDMLGVRPFVQDTVANRPTYTAPTESSNGYLSFGASGATKLTNAFLAVTKTVVIVNRPTSTSINLAGLFGPDGVDDGIRQYNTNPQWQWGYKTFLANGNTAHKDGTAYTTGNIGFTLNQWHVLIVDRVALSDTACTMKTAIGGYLSTAYFKGDIGEVLVYNRSLSTPERRSLEAYLGTKWGLTISGNPASTAGTLPFMTDLTVYTNASVNLNGVTQYVASVTCGGQITNGTLSVTSGNVSVLKGGATMPGTAFTASQAMSVVMQSTDALTLQGNADISNTTFSFSDVESIPLNAPFTLASSTGTLTTGTLTSLITTSLPPSRLWVVRKIENAVIVTLAPQGTMISFQ